ncbi:MAG: hypothetical protein VKJ06_09135 [Vampirovibrionales bacterium]|nr:hypothetical protein [Vampirovibrionales bacterium]
MATGAWIWATHIAAVAFLLGSQLFIALGTNPIQSKETQFKTLGVAFGRVMPFTVLALVGLLSSGVWQIIQFGGMKGLPVMFHIKLTFALVFVVLGLVQALMIYPKWQQQPSAAAGNAGAMFWYLSIAQSLAGLGALVCLALV